MSVLPVIEVVADVLTAANTNATKRGVEAQQQMLFDAMQPEQQLRVLAAAAAREKERERENARRRGFFLFCCAILGIFWLLSYLI